MKVTNKQKDMICKLMRNKDASIEEFKTTFEEYRDKYVSCFTKNNLLELVDVRITNTVNKVLEDILLNYKYNTMFNISTMVFTEENSDNLYGLYFIDCATGKLLQLRRY